MSNRQFNEPIIGTLLVFDQIQNEGLGSLPVSKSAACIGQAWTLLRVDTAGAPTQTFSHTITWSTDHGRLSDLPQHQKIPWVKRTAATNDYAELAAACWSATRLTYWYTWSARRKEWVCSWSRNTKTGIFAKRPIF